MADEFKNIIYIGCELMSQALSFNKVRDHGQLDNETFSFFVVHSCALIGTLQK